MKISRILITLLASMLAVLGIMRLLQPSTASAAFSASAGDVVINEIAWGGTAASSSDEWIELINNTGSMVDLTGWTLRADDGTPNITLSGSIAASGYYLLERTDDNAVSDIPADQIYTGASVNSGETLRLVDTLSNTIDTVNADGGGWPAGSASPNYYSMERVYALSGGDDANWASNDGVTRNGLDVNSNPLNGTPGQANSVAAAPLGVQITKQASPDSVVRNEPFTYTVRITNTGMAVLDPLVLTDTLPSDFFYVSASGSPTDPNTIAEPLLVWNSLGPLSIGQSITITYAITGTPVSTGTHVNMAQVQGFGPAASISDTASVAITIVEPSIDVDLQLFAADTDLVFPNFITLTTRVSNTGPDTISILPMLQRYDLNSLSFESAIPVPNEPADDGEVTWYGLQTSAPNGFGQSLPSGQEFLLTTTFRIMQDITSTTTITAIVTNALDVYNNAASAAVDTVTINNLPTAVELVSFEVSGVDNHQVNLAWETAVEIDNFGFNLYRASENDFARAELIHFEPSSIGGNGPGATYSYVDNAPSDGGWWYWLADLDTQGLETVHNAISVLVGPDSIPHKLYLPFVARQSSATMSSLSGFKGWSVL